MPSESVILLHGIFRTRLSMRGLAGFLERANFHSEAITYPSTRYALGELAAIIHPQVQAAAARGRRIHFVGHSMGGLLIRAYIHAHRPENLGRVVMLGTPNRGSEVADFLQGMKPYQWLYGAAGQQLVTKQEPFAAMLGRVDYDLGIIAGDRSLAPVSSYIIGKANDGKVSVESTKLEGMKAHLVVPCSHTFLPSQQNVWRQAAHFLRHGQFIS